MFLKEQQKKYNKYNKHSKNSIIMQSPEVCDNLKNLA